MTSIENAVGGTSFPTSKTSARSTLPEKQSRRSEEIPGHRRAEDLVHRADILARVVGTSSSGVWKFVTVDAIQATGMDEASAIIDGCV
ncbi:MAG: hypothetical protein MMC33_001031 [Icmadophila ericetorum]|nr:hypothetical protein [Icmadophila ericetorum]